MPAADAGLMPGDRVETVDGNYPPVVPPEAQAPPPNGDAIAAFVTPPPGVNPICPSAPLTTNPVATGGLIVF